MQGFLEVELDAPAAGRVVRARARAGDPQRRADPLPKYTVGWGRSKSRPAWRCGSRGSPGDGATTRGPPGRHHHPGTDRPLPHCTPSTRGHLSALKYLRLPSLAPLLAAVPTGEPTV